MDPRWLDGYCSSMVIDGDLRNLWSPGRLEMEGRDFGRENYRH